MEVNIGKGITLDVNANALPANAMAHVVYIGLRNILMDAHASVTAESAEAEQSAGEDIATTIARLSRAKAETKLAALMSGEVRVAATRGGDPVRAEALRLATNTVKTAIKAKGKKLKEYTDEAVRKAAQDYLDRHSELLDTAKANIAAAREAADDVEI